MLRQPLLLLLRHTAQLLQQHRLGPGAADALAVPPAHPQKYSSAPPTAA
jgi:hypothetical protein